MWSVNTMSHSTFLVPLFASEPWCHHMLISVQGDISPFWAHHNPPISLLTLIIFSPSLHYCHYMVLDCDSCGKRFHGSNRPGVSCLKGDKLQEASDRMYWQRPMVSKLYRWVISYVLCIWHQSSCMTIFRAMPTLQQGLSIWPFPHYLWPMQGY